MTPDELARVPEGGVIWRVDKDGVEGDCEIIALAPDKDWYEDTHVYASGVFEDDARQIVGSVNSAIIRNTKCTRDGFFSSKEDMADFNFWLDYSKGVINGRV